MMGSKKMIVGLYEPLEKPAFMIINRYHTSKKFEANKSDVSEIFKGDVLGMKCFCDEAEELGSKIITLEDPSHPLSESLKELSSNVEKAS
jgi:hypothetical protein